MRKIFLLLIITIIWFEIFGQGIGIGSSNFTPNSKSILELQATGKGLLIPRMTFANRPSGMSSADTAMLIYQTDTIPGFYYYNGSVWKMLFTDAWSLNGNLGTNAVNNFLGTRDSIDLVFRTNLNERMRITASGNIGIGTTTPTEKLDVSGNFRFSQALMPNNNPGTTGKVLKSNGANTAPTWISTVTNDNIYSVESTSSLAITSGTFTTIPGESITIPSLIAGDRLMIYYSGNAYMDGSDYNTVDVAVFANGTMVQIGGYVRFSLDSDYAEMTWQNYSAIARYTIPTNGSYTFDVRAMRNMSGNTIYIGGTSTQAAEGVLVIYVLRN